jgi:hypothetical protein
MKIKEKMKINYVNILKKFYEVQVVTNNIILITQYNPL